MTELGDLAPPVVGAATGLHGHHAGRQRCQERQKLAAAQLLAKVHRARVRAAPHGPLGQPAQYPSTSTATAADAMRAAITRPRFRGVLSLAAFRIMTTQSPAEKKASNQNVVRDIFGLE